MTCAPPPLVGFNNNVRYRGLWFHIQTEDSGVARPHIITHLFADGGRVINSMRTDYSELIREEYRPERVYEMMKEQHRTMARALSHGELDDVIDELKGAGPRRQENEERRSSTNDGRLAEMNSLSSGRAPSRDPSGALDSPDSFRSPVARELGRPSARAGEYLKSLFSVEPANTEAPGGAATQRSPMQPASESASGSAAGSSSASWVATSEAPLPRRSSAPPKLRPSRRPKAPEALSEPVSHAPPELTRSSSVAPHRMGKMRVAKPRVTTSAPRKAVGRPSVQSSLPSGGSIFGAKPDEGLDDAILSYLSAGPKTPSSK